MTFGESFTVALVLFERGHYEGRMDALRFAQKKMDMFGHDDVAYDHEVMALSIPLHNFEEQVTVLGSAEKRAALVATGGDEVEISGTVIAV